MCSTKEYCNFALDGCLYVAINGGRKEDGGGLSLIGIGGFDDGKKGNAYIRILFFKIRLPWW